MSNNYPLTTLEKARIKGAMIRRGLTREQATAEVMAIRETAIKVTEKR